MTYPDHDLKDIRIRLSKLHAANRNQVNEVYAQAIEDAGRSAERMSAGKRDAADVAQADADAVIDLLARMAPGSTGLPILSENRISGLVYEAVVHWRLAG